jgi:hypothetical protein
MLGWTSKAIKHWGCQTPENALASEPGLGFHFHIQQYLSVSSSVDH